MTKNLEKKVIEGFGEEWNKFDQSTIKIEELKKAFDQYFNIFPKSFLNKNNEGFDMGCGSGRWAKLVAPDVKNLNCIDPSYKAIEVAKKNLNENSNVIFFLLKVNEECLRPNSQDFGYCLGVLHHVRDTQEGINSCFKILKKNSPFLIYLYYRFDNKPIWFKIIWKASDLIRKTIMNLPFSMKKIITYIIALLIYLPLSKISKLFFKLGFEVKNFPLSDYKDKSFYFMSTDALDRFGTRLEKRFTKIEIKQMLEKAGFKDIEFSDSTPYWVCLAWKR